MEDVGDDGLGAAPPAVEGTVFRPGATRAWRDDLDVDERRRFGTQLMTGGDTSAPVGGTVRGYDGTITNYGDGGEGGGSSGWSDMVRC